MRGFSRIFTPPIKEPHLTRSWHEPTRLIGVAVLAGLVAAAGIALPAQAEPDAQQAVDRYLEAQDSATRDAWARNPQLPSVRSTARVNKLENNHDRLAESKFEVVSKLSVSYSAPGLPDSEEIQRYVFSYQNGRISAERQDSQQSVMRREVEQSRAERAARDSTAQRSSIPAPPVPPKWNKSASHTPSAGARSAQTPTSYDVNAAMNYASAWWNSRNSQYPIAGENTDCTNFTSQILRAGGWDDYAPDLWKDDPPNLLYYRQPDVWFYVPGYIPQPNSWTWSAANNLLSFPLYHDNRGEYQSAGTAAVGDVIFFDWNGDDTADHVMVVSHVADDGSEALTGHTGDRWNYALSLVMESAYAEYGRYPGLWRLRPA